MADPTEHVDEAAALQEGFFGGQPPRYVLTRFVFMRALGLMHVVAFAVLVLQGDALIGSDGLLPAADFVDRLRDGDGFLGWPTLFLWSASDLALRVGAWVGLALALAVLAGAENALLQLCLWALYMSFVHVGQIFWGYGWETLLLETTFLSIFLCPLRSVRPLSGPLPPPTPVIWMLRFLTFRLMLGAGLIKIRGDACWTDLSCLVYHYETQPNPHPLSWLLHQAPVWFHQGGVLFNHLVELIVPFAVFGPGRLRIVGGCLVIAFQTLLILSGNLSFLNWLSITAAIACFDDRVWGRLLPATLVDRAATVSGDWYAHMGTRVTIGLLSLLVVTLSHGPLYNMLSPKQAMNTSFDPLHLVNSYGAFGSIGKVRDEVILQGTRSARPDDGAEWLEYEFPCKPGDVSRRPCLVTPYHYRLDWQMWFAALGNPNHQPWLVHLMYKLLLGDATARTLLTHDPFAGGEPPRFVRAERYRYRFTRLGDGSDAYWARERLGPYLPALSLEHPGLRRFLRGRDWLRH